MANGNRYIYLFNNSVAASKTYMWRYDTGFAQSNCYSEISDNGEYILVGAGNYLLLFNTSYTTLNKEAMWSYNNMGYDILCISISADGMYFAAGTSDAPEILYLFNRTSSTHMWSYSLSGTPEFIAMSASGDYIAVAYDDVSVSLFNKTIEASKTPMWTNDTINTMDLTSLDISADGTKIVYGDINGRVYLLDNTYSTDKSALWVYTHYMENIYCKISSNGEYIVGWARFSGTYGDNSVIFLNTTLETPKTMSNYPDVCDLSLALTIPEAVRRL